MGAPRYPSGPRGPGGVRMPQGIGNEFNGVSEINFLNFCYISKVFRSILLTFVLMCNIFIFVSNKKPPGQPMMPNSMDPSRQGIFLILNFSIFLLHIQFSNSM